MLYTARIFVSLKPSVNDPQGITVRQGLIDMGFDGVTDVSVGKYIELTVESDTQNIAEDTVRDMCGKLLSNPVIERYDFEIIKDD
jgi:phosphoribosylformylglycinamidine synthase PurS subunit|tara:strand:- start:391 stop:645 length:255 start_codon:yes stop_codon:yes gene_type:complete